MYYDLVIHPSRIELLERVFSPDTAKFREKKLASTDIDFKFDTSVIESGKHYNSLKSSLKKLLDPFRNDLSLLNIVVLPAFISYKAIESSQNFTGLEDYINWEASKIPTDVPEHYIYGTFYDMAHGFLIIAMMRKSVKEYFHGIMNDVYPDGLEFNIGCRYNLSGDRTEFIHLDKTIRNDFSFNIGTEGSSVKKKSAFIAFSFLFLTAVLAAFYYLNPAQFKDITGYWSHKLVDILPYSDVEVRSVEPSVKITPSETENTVSDAQEAEAVEPETQEPQAVEEKLAEIPEKIEPAPKEAVPETPKETPKKAVESKKVPAKKEVIVEKKVPARKTPVFWDLVIELTKLEADSIVFINREGIFVYSDKADIINSAKSSDPETIYEIESDEGNINFSHSSFYFENARLRSNYNMFVEVKDSFEITPIKYYKNIFRVEPAELFYEFLKSLEENEVGFKKFIISNKKDFMMFTVYFG
jgi:hypothetical protein